MITIGQTYRSKRYNFTVVVVKPLVSPVSDSRDYRYAWRCRRVVTKFYIDLSERQLLFEYELVEHTPVSNNEYIEEEWI